MSEKHLANGSACPPLKSGTMRIYSMKFCPFAQRTRIVLAAKNIPHETVNINLSSKPDWFLKKNPLGLVPVLEKDGVTIYESDVTSDYLDEQYPQNPLQPKDPLRRAHDRIILAHWGKVTSPLYRLYQADPADVPAITDEIKTKLDFIESALSKRGSTFFGGEKPAMVDYMMWPHMERFPMVETLRNINFEWAERFPHMNTWSKMMSEDPAVKATMVTVETHAKFAQSFKNGVPDYDM